MWRSRTGVASRYGALLGLVPARQSTRPDVPGALRSDSAGGSQPDQLRWRNALVVTQLTISLVLLVGAGRSPRTMIGVDPAAVGVRHTRAAEELRGAR